MCHLLESTRYGDILGQVINTVARFDPATPVYDADGNYNFKALKGVSSKIYADNDVWNPMATALETRAERNNITNEISTFLEFKLLAGLTLRITGRQALIAMMKSIIMGQKHNQAGGLMAWEI